MKLSKVILSKLSHDDLVEIVSELMAGDPEIREAVWQREARRLYAQNKRVAGIRECRQATGWSLRVAKEYCDTNYPVGEEVPAQDAWD